MYFRASEYPIPNYNGVLTGFFGKRRELTLNRKFDRIAYYTKNIFLDSSPAWLFRRKIYEILCRSSGYDRNYISNRVNYYNKIENKLDINNYTQNIGQISMKRSFYYYDLKEHARYFPRYLKLDYEFGDLDTVPERPKFVKSRPILGDNANSILMKLAKFRHFYIPPDDIPFENKKPVAVWRGGEHNSKRLELMRRYRGHPLCDIGFTNAASPQNQRSAFLHPRQQMAYRYVISVEGNDVATNLKWILASNSLCMMAEPTCETWFMEGRLKAGEHYVRVADDFEDLEDKILYYERNPQEAREIIRNANRHAEQFLDEPCEQLISILVMYKFFAATGQLEPPETIAGLL